MGSEPGAGSHKSQPRWRQAVGHLERVAHLSRSAEAPIQVLARFPSVTKNMIDAFRPYQAHLQLACDESGNTVFHFFSTAAGPRTHYYVRHLLHTWKCANARAPNRAGVTAGELFAQTGQLRCARLCGYSPAR